MKIQELLKGQLISIIACVLAIIAIVVSLVPNNGIPGKNGINGLDGKDGINGSDGKDGVDGEDGKDGVTPTIEISDDGYWVINGEKTDVKATPEDSACENPQELQFYMQDDGTYIVSSGDAIYLSNIVIPATYKGGAVVTIAEDAFTGFDLLESVTIPNSVVIIECEAFFSCSSLMSVTIPDSVISIGDRAFHGCRSLTSVTIGDSVVSIGESAFWNCDSLTNLTLGDSLTSIGEYAFTYCYSLTNITIPDSVTTICDDAFLHCKALSTIHFEGTVEQWKAIEFGDHWNYNVPATEVICSDGTVPLN